MRAACWTSYWNKFGCGNWVVLVCRKGTRQWGWCHGQTAHGEFGAIPHSLSFTSMAGHDGTSCHPQTHPFPLKQNICKTVPACIASVGFTCPHLGTWKWETEGQGGHPGPSSWSEAKGGWLTSLSDQDSSSSVEEPFPAMSAWGAFSFPPKLLTATSTFPFYVLCCKLLFLPPAHSRFSAPKTSRQPGFPVQH